MSEEDELLVGTIAGVDLILSPEHYKKYKGTLNRQIEELKFQLQQKENIIKEVREYIEKDTRWFDSEYAKTYGELCTCPGANDTRLEVLVNPSNLLKILDKEK